MPDLVIAGCIADVKQGGDVKHKRMGKKKKGGAEEIHGGAIILALAIVLLLSISVTLIYSAYVPSPREVPRVQCISPYLCQGTTVAPAFFILLVNNPDEPANATIDLFFYHYDENMTKVGIPNAAIIVKHRCADGVTDRLCYLVTDVNSSGKYDFGHDLERCSNCTPISFIFCRGDVNDPGVLQNCTGYSYVDSCTNASDVWALGSSVSPSLLSYTVYDNYSSSTQQVSVCGRASAAGLSSYYTTVCFPAFVVIALLMSAMFMTGYNPFNILGVHPPKAPRGAPYKMRPQSVSFTMSAIVSTVGGTIKGMVKGGKAGAKGSPGGGGGGGARGGSRGGAGGGAGARGGAGPGARGGAREQSGARRGGGAGANPPSTKSAPGSRPPAFVRGMANVTANIKMVQQAVKYGPALLLGSALEHTAGSVVSGIVVGGLTQGQFTSTGDIKKYLSTVGTPSTTVVAQSLRDQMTGMTGGGAGGSGGNLLTSWLSGFAAHYTGGVSNLIDVKDKNGNWINIMQWLSGQISSVTGTGWRALWGTGEYRKLSEGAQKLFDAFKDPKSVKDIQLKSIANEGTKDQTETYTITYVKPDGTTYTADVTITQKDKAPLRRLMENLFKEMAKGGKDNAEFLQRLVVLKDSFISTMFMGTDLGYLLSLAQMDKKVYENINNDKEVKKLQELKAKAGDSDEDNQAYLKQKDKVADRLYDKYGIDLDGIHMDQITDILASGKLDASYFTSMYNDLKVQYGLQMRDLLTALSGANSIAGYFNNSERDKLQKDYEKQKDKLKTDEEKNNFHTAEKDRLLKEFDAAIKSGDDDKAAAALQKFHALELAFGSNIPPTKALENQLFAEMDMLVTGTNSAYNIVAFLCSTGNAKSAVEVNDVVLGKDGLIATWNSKIDEGLSVAGTASTIEGKTAIMNGVYNAAASVYGNFSNVGEYTNSLTAEYMLNSGTEADAMISQILAGITKNSQAAVAGYNPEWDRTDENLHGMAAAKPDIALREYSATAEQIENLKNRVSATTDIDVQTQLMEEIKTAQGRLERIAGDLSSAGISDPSTHLKDHPLPPIEDADKPAFNTYSNGVYSREEQVPQRAEYNKDMEQRARDTETSTQLAAIDIMKDQRDYYEKDMSSIERGILNNVSPEFIAGSASAFHGLSSEAGLAYQYFYTDPKTGDVVYGLPRDDLDPAKAKENEAVLEKDYALARANLDAAAAARDFARESAKQDEEDRGKNPINQAFEAYVDNVNHLTEQAKNLDITQFGQTWGAVSNMLDSSRDEFLNISAEEEELRRKKAFAWEYYDVAEWIHRVVSRPDKKRVDEYSEYLKDMNSRVDSAVATASAYSERGEGALKKEYLDGALALSLGKRPAGDVTYDNWYNSDKRNLLDGKSDKELSSLARDGLDSQKAANQVTSIVDAYNKKIGSNKMK